LHKSHKNTENFLSYLSGALQAYSLRPSALTQVGLARPAQRLLLPCCCSQAAHKRVSG